MRTTHTLKTHLRRALLAAFAFVLFATLAFTFTPLSAVMAKLGLGKPVKQLLTATEWPAPAKSPVKVEANHAVVGSAAMAVGGSAALFDAPITKSASPPDGTAVSGGQLITYTITVENDAAIDETFPPNRLRVRDAIPANTTYEPGSVTILNQPGNGSALWTCSFDGGNNRIECLTAVGGDMREFTTFKFEFKVRVNSSATGAIVSNQAQFFNEQQTGATPTNLSNTTNHPVAQADLGITKTTSNANPVNGGAAFNYTLTVTNNGPGAAYGVVVTDPLPAGIVFQGVTVTNTNTGGLGLTCSGPPVGTNGVVSCTGNFPAPSPAIPTSTIIITAQAASAQAGGNRTNTATVASNTQEPTPNVFPNSASVQQALQNNASLIITKVATATACAGENITYTISVRNTGNSDALNVVVTDPLPANTTFVSVSGAGAFAGNCGFNPGTNTVTCSAPVLDNSLLHNIQLVVKTAPNTPIGNLTNAATLSAGVGAITGANPATASTAVSRCGDLSIVKTAPGSVVAGSTIDYLLKLTNHGPSDIAGGANPGTIVIMDTLPVQIATLVSARAGTGEAGGFTCTPAGPLTPAGGVKITCVNAAGTAGDFPVGAMTTIVLKVVIASNAVPGTNIENCAMISAPPAGPITNPAGQFDLNTSNNTSCASFVVTSSADLSMTKSSLPVVDPDGAGPLAPVPLPVVGPNVPPGSVSAGGYIRYDLPFGNSGPSDAVNVMITDQIPGNTAFVGALATGGVFVPGAQPPSVPFTFTIQAADGVAPLGPNVNLTCTVNGAPGSQAIYCRPQGNTGLTPSYADGTLPAGYTGQVTFFVKVNESVTGGTIVSNPANITSGLCPNANPPAFPPSVCASTNDPNTSNNTTLSTSNVVIAASQLSISKIVQSAVTTASNPNQTGPLGPASPSNGTATTNFANLVALSNANTLLRLSSSAPGTVIGAPLPITGLVAGDTVVSIDTRPTTGQVFAIATNAAGTIAHLYTLNTGTGVATQVGGNIALPQSAGVAGPENALAIDFNPTVDRIRVVAPTRDNFRLNPDTGAVAGADTALTAGSNIVAIAYSNNFASATQTTLYAIDSNTDQLVTIGGINGVPSPNGGVVTAIGALGVNTSAAASFEILNDGSGTALAVLTVGGAPGLYSINLTTGSATLIGTVAGGATPILGLTSVSAGVLPGTQLTYRVTITNNGPSDVANVRLTDFLPSGLESPPGRVLGVRYVSVSQVPGIGGATFTCAPPTGIPPVNNPQSNGGTVQCTAPILSANAPNNVAAFDVVVFIDPATKQPLVNSARVDATTNNFNQPVSATTVLTTPVAPNSDLALTKTHTNAAGVVGGPVTAGEVFTYTITVNNNGPSAAQMFRLVDTLPAFQQVRSISVAQSPDGNGAPAVTCTANPPIGAPTGTGNNTTSVTCTAAELPPNRNPNGTVNPAGTVVITITARQDQATPQPVPSSYQNCVTATSMSFDPNTSNNINICDTIPVAFLADLSGTKTAAPDPVIAGNLLTYTITANNAGPSAALNLMISDPLPIGTVFISAAASPGATLTTPAVGANGLVKATWDAAGGTPGGLTLPGVVRTLTIVVRVCPDFQQIRNLTDAQMCVPNMTDTATISSDTPDPNPGNNTASFTSTVQAQSDLSISKSVAPNPAPYSTTGVPSNVTYTLTFANAGPSNANGVTIVDVLPKGFTVVGTPTSTVPGTTFNITTTNGITTIVANLGVLGAANQCQVNRPISGTITIVARVPIKHPTITVTNTATIASTNCLPETGTLAVQTNPLSGEPAIIAPGTGMLANNRAFADLRVIPPGTTPGIAFPALSEVSDQKEGSVLFYPIYTSDATNANSQNTRINITNTSMTERATVHLFAVDGATCAVLDAFLCLTPNQTSSFLASDFDPGNTGYLMAVAVEDDTGLPRAFNELIGDEFVKFSSGHQANLGAEAIAASMMFPAGTNANATTATLRFDGMNYNRLPRILAASSIASRAEGNSTMLIFNRVGGDMTTSGALIGNINGVLYDDTENAFSFTSNVTACQFRRILDNGFPRTFTPFDRLIPAGRTGWMKFWTVNDAALLGAQINLNPNAGSSAGAFNQGHNLHHMTLSNSATLVIPVFIPSC